MYRSKKRMRKNSERDNIDAPLHNTCDMGKVQEDESTVKWKNICSMETANKTSLIRPKSGMDFSLILFDVVGDGSCLFYSIMLGMHRMNIAVSQKLDCGSVRNQLGDLIDELSEAGTIGSRFRREWLRSALLLLPRKIPVSLSQRWIAEIDFAEHNCDPERYQRASQHIRCFLRDHANAIRRTEWGGSFTLEIRLLASPFGIGIEVYSDIDGANAVSEAVLFAFEPAHGPVLVPLTIRGSFIPEGIILPSPVDSYMPGMDRGELLQKVPEIPILKLYFTGSHYQLCGEKEFSKERNDVPTPRIPGERPPLAAPFACLDANEEKNPQFRVEKCRLGEEYPFDV